MSNTAPPPSPSELVTGVADLARDYGAVPGKGIDNTVVMQTALDDMIAGRFGTLYVPPGRWQHRGLTIAVPADGSANVNLVGAGRRLVQIQNTAVGAPNLTITAPNGNVRDVVISDLSLWSGDVALHAYNASYGLFRNVTFCYTDRMATELIECHHLVFDQCWWVHNSGETLTIVSGSAHIGDSVIGEDSGEIDVRGELSLTGCHIFSTASKLTAPNGPNGMGRCVFHVKSNGAVNLAGCRISSDHNLFNINYGDGVIAAGCHLSAKGAVIAQRVNDRGSSAVLTGNVISLRDAAQLYKETSTGHLRNSVISDNQIYLTGTFAATFEDDLIDPANNNDVSGNIIRHGETP